MLPLLAGGELDRGERLAAEAHVSFCADCARELELYREARAQLAEMRMDEPPAGTWRELSRGIEAEIRSMGIRPARAAARFAAALAAGLVIGLAIHAALGAIRRPSPSPAAVAVGLGAPGEFVAAGAAAKPRPDAWSMRVRVEPGSKSPAAGAAPDGRYYLPRVEYFPPPVERDF